MPNKLTYYHRLSKEIYGPAEIKVTKEQQRESSIEVFDYCHDSNSSTTEFSMTNEVSVSGVMKVFDIGASHSNTFATTSTRATETGRDITTFEKDFVSTKTEITRTIPKETCLCHYVGVDLLCFTVNGGKRQYAHIPRSDTLIEPFDEKKFSEIANGTIHMEKKSWELVTSRFPSIHLDDVDALARKLTPLDIKVDVLTTMGRVGILSCSSNKYLDGRLPQHQEVFISGGNHVTNKFLQWTIEKVDGNYAIKSVSSKKYLDGRNSSFENKYGALFVTGREPKGDKSLQWKIEKVDGKFALKSLSSGLYIDGRNSSFKDNEVLLTNRKPQGEKNLQWEISTVLEDAKISFHLTMPNKLTYYHRLSKDQIDYGPAEIKVTKEQQRETSIEVFDYCHDSNSSTTEFSMTNEVSVSGVIKVFDIGASHSNTFATTSTRATETGRDITTFEKDFVSTKTEITRTIPKDTCLCHYVGVDLLCFTVNGGKRQYAHIPRSDTLIEPFDEKKFSEIANGTIYMEKKSWELVTSRFPSIHLDDVDALARELTPLDIKVDVLATMMERAGVLLPLRPMIEKIMND